MASPQKLEVEIDIKCNAEKFWGGLKNLTTFLPRASPDKYESIEVLEGDGISVGSVFTISHPPERPMPITKKKLELVDEENKILSYSLTDGDFVRYCKNFKDYVVVIPKGEGALVKWSCEFESATEDVPSPGVMIDFVVKSAQDLDAYLREE